MSCPNCHLTTPGLSETFTLTEVEQVLIWLNHPTLNPDISTTTTTVIRYTPVCCVAYAEHQLATMPANHAYVEEF